MNAFETTAVLDDASHLTLHEPVPRAARRDCRVIVLFGDSGDTAPPATSWPADFFASILISDPTFVRPTQGEAPPVAALDTPR